MAQQVRLEKDVEALLWNERERIRTEEATVLSSAQAVNRMLREWRKQKDSAARRKVKP